MSLQFNLNSKIKVLRDLNFEIKKKNMNFY